MTKRLPKAELDRRKREREAAQMASDSARKALIREDDKIVEAALAERAGRGADPRWHPDEETLLADLHAWATIGPGSPNGPKPEWVPRIDPIELDRYHDIVDGNARFYEYFNRRFKDHYPSPKSHEHAKRAVAQLEEWCRATDHPGSIPAFSVYRATCFLTAMAAKGCARRTLENYRAVYARLWEHYLDSRADWIAAEDRGRPAGRKRARPFLNPWTQPETRPTQIIAATTKSPPRHRASGYRLSRTSAASIANLDKGRQVRAKRVSAEAERLEMFVALRRDKGRKSAHQLAVELNEVGLRTPRGKQWDSKSVDRLLGRLGLKRSNG